MYFSKQTSQGVVWFCYTVETKDVYSSLVVVVVEANITVNARDLTPVIMGLVIPTRGPLDS